MCFFLAVAIEATEKNSRETSVRTIKLAGNSEIVLFSK